MLYITEHLFDSDDDIEFLYSVNTGICPQFFTGIYNEDGTAILTQDSASPVVHFNIPVVAKPVYNTANGTKMILSFPCTKEAKVYSLPGILSTTSIHRPENSGNKKSLLAYPNPSSNKTTIRYKLPQGVDHGEIVIYQLNGIEAKKYNVDNTFDTLVIENNDLPNGTYFYSLKTKDRILETKKLMVIN